MDWVVTIIGVIGFYLAGQKVWWAWYVNIANQVLWLIFAVVTEQWGFLIGIPLYMSVFIKNAVDWTKEHRLKQKIVAGLREPIGKITLLENRSEGHSCSCHVRNAGACAVCKELGCEVWDFNQVAMPREE